MSNLFPPVHFDFSNQSERRHGAAKADLVDLENNTLFTAPGDEGGGVYYFN